MKSQKPNRSNRWKGKPYCGAGKKCPCNITVGESWPGLASAKGWLLGQLSTSSKLRQVFAFFWSEKDKGWQHKKNTERKKGAHKERSLLSPFIHNVFPLLTSHFMGLWLSECWQELIGLCISWGRCPVQEQQQLWDIFFKVNILLLSRSKLGVYRF